MNKSLLYPFILFCWLLATGNIDFVGEAEASSEVQEFINEEGGFTLPPEYSGKVVILNFWATWCDVCQREMPELSKLQDRYGSNGLEVIAVSIDTASKGATSEERVRNFVAAHRLQNLNIILDSRGKLMRIMGVRGLPTTFVFDSNGNPVAKVEGYFDAGRSEAFIESLL